VSTEDYQDPATSRARQLGQAAGLVPVARRASRQRQGRQAVKTVGQGAATTIVVATSPLLAGVTGRYFEDGNQAEVIGPEGVRPPGHPRGVAWYALDPGNAARLWGLSQKVGQPRQARSGSGQYARWRSASGMAECLFGLMPSA
jgi:hypothetical protein